MPARPNTGPKGPSKPMDEQMFEQAKGAASVGGTAEEIADLLRMTVPTLEARLQERGYVNFLDFRKKHFAGRKLSLRRRQFATADEGNVTMQIWLGKQHLGQKDRQELDQISSDGSMSPNRVLSGEELDKELAKRGIPTTILDE
jgi:hypothetical protein